MKTNLFFYNLLLLILLGVKSFSQTTIPGGAVSGTWTKASSPYLVQGAILVTEGTVLTIEPGTRIEFQGPYKLLIMGKVLAVGTTADSITFTASNQSVYWEGIHFETPSPTVDTSRFKYCKFHFSRAKNAAPYNNGGAFYFENASKAVIANSLISDCSADASGAAIYCYKSNPLIMNNKIQNDSAETATISLMQSSPVIRNNIISYNVASLSAGIYCKESDPLIYSNTISNNRSKRGGGTISCSEICSPVISKNTITYNSITHDPNSFSAGGILCEKSKAIISGNTISYNKNNAGGSAGIMINYCDSVNITDNTISYNEGTDGQTAGGIAIESSYRSYILNNKIFYNYALGLSSGGIYVHASSDMHMGYNLIANNSSTLTGGGITCNYIMASSIHNNVIVNNSTITGDGRGGGIYFQASSPDVVNNTIANNFSKNGGGFFLTQDSDPVCKNNIIWGNKSASGGDQVYLLDEPSDPPFTYCTIQGGSAAFGTDVNVFYLGTYTNNIDSDPKFVKPSITSGSGTDGLTGNWSLDVTSPCINKGDPNGMYPAVDIAGHTRVSNGIIDIGAYEILLTGIKEQADISLLKVYPNPCNGLFTIDSGNLKAAAIRIYTVTGECIYSKQNLTDKYIDIQDQPKGVYFMQLLDEGHIAFAKLIVQ